MSNFTFFAAYKAADATPFIATDFPANASSDPTATGRPHLLSIVSPLSSTIRETIIATHCSTVVSTIVETVAGTDGTTVVSTYCKSFFSTDHVAIVSTYCASFGMPVPPALKPAVSTTHSSSIQAADPPTSL